MKLKDVLACLADVCGKMKIEQVYAAIDMEFLERYFEYCYLGEGELEMVVLFPLGRELEDSVETFVYLAGLGSLREFQSSFHGIWVKPEGERKLISISCDSDEGDEQESYLFDDECKLRFAGPTRHYMGMLLLKLDEISRVLFDLGYECYAYFEITKEFEELIREYEDIEYLFENYEYEEDWLMGDSPYWVVYSYLLLRGAIRLEEISMKKAVKKFCFHFPLKGGDVTLVLHTNGRCRLEIDINQEKSEVDRKEVELVAKTIRGMLPSWIKVEKVVWRFFPKNTEH